MNLLTVDFETYYDREYSLSKITTEEYIRSNMFEVIGVAVKENSEPAQWFTGSKEEVYQFLSGYPFETSAVLAHNTMFDGAILSWHFGIRPKMWLDTLSMSRPFHGIDAGGSLKALATYYNVGEKGDEVVQALGRHRLSMTPFELNQYGKYCCNDVEITYKLFKKLVRKLPSNELYIIDLLIRMYTEPKFKLDSEVLNSHLEDVVDNRLALLAELNEISGGDLDSIMSNMKFASLLRSFGVTPPTKISLRTNKVTYAFAKTDPGIQELLEHPDQRVQVAISARLGLKSTIEETRTRALLSVAERGRLPIMLNYHGARTGRLSGGEKLNLQNLPARQGNAIRRALRAPEGHVVIACDLAQIEARILSWLAGQIDLVESFRDGRDVYSEFATKIYGRQITKDDKTERFVGKTCILGLGYMLGADKLQKALSEKVDTPLEECRRIVNLYRAENSMISALWQRANLTLHKIAAGEEGELHTSVLYDREGFVLPNGLKIRYPFIHNKSDVGSELVYIADQRSYKKLLKGRFEDGRTANDPFYDDCWTKIYGGKAVENICQALAAIIIKHHMAKSKEHGYPPVLQVHDEIVTIVPEDDAESAQQTLVEIMSTPPEWCADLPIACEASIARNYGDTK